jgi:Rrf2 family protein
MVKINRVTEYGLIALRHMSRKRAGEPRSVTSAREIADHYQLPFEITAKMLQRLRDHGLIESAQGARGGYTLSCELEAISLARFLQMMEGGPGVVNCAEARDEKPADSEKSACACDYEAHCEIKGAMSMLNRRVWDFLDGIRLSELTGDQPLETFIPVSAISGVSTIPTSTQPRR